MSLSGTAVDGSPYGVSAAAGDPRPLSGYAWSGDLGWIDFSGASIMTPLVLQVCRDGVPISGPGLTFSLAPNQVTDLRAYFDQIPDCSGSDITDAPMTTWSESGPNAVSLSGTNPKTVTAGAVPSLAEQVTVANGSASVTMNISVVCSETVTCTDERAAVCTGETVAAGTVKAGTCGPVDCGGQAGTRYCDFNWKEVAPGQ